jgi:hypothetical protein
VEEMKKSQKQINTKRLKEIEKELGKYYSKMSPLKKERESISSILDREKAIKYIGNCYIFKNSGLGHSKEWNLYIKIIGVNEHSNLITLRFEVYPDSKWNARLETAWSSSLIDNTYGSYVEIPASKFDEEYEKLLHTLVSYTPNLVVTEDDNEGITY